MTKERKIYGAVLTLAMTALGGSFWPGSSKDPGAAEAALVKTETPAQVAAEPTAPAPTVSAKPAAEAPHANQAVAVVSDKPVISVAQRLRSVKETPANCIDAFAPLQIEHVQVAQTDLDAAAFKEKHHIGGVFLSGRHSYAIIDGKPLRMGQSIEGFKLAELKAQSATFESGGKKVVLAMPTEIASGN